MLFRTIITLCVLTTCTQAYWYEIFVQPCQDVHASKSSCQHGGDSGPRLDYCLVYGKKCGWNAAYDFCRSKGWLRVWEYVVDHKPRETKCLGDDRKCFGSHCDGFHQITCSHKSGLLVNDGKPKVFQNPKFRDMPLDWCFFWEDHCGQEAADSYCRMRGYKRAVSFRKSALPKYWGPTRTRCIGDSRVCDKRYHNGGCDTFSYIKCDD